MCRYYGVIGPLEVALKSFDWGSRTFDMARRQKAAWIHDDLRSLGLSINEIDRIDMYDSNLSERSFEEALGTAYVIEGSTLGGVLISRELQSMGITPQNGGRYFNSYGPEVGKYWAEFRQLLESQALLLDADLIVLGAMSAFSAVEKWLCAADSVTANLKGGGVIPESASELLTAQL
jgi:heme oxygenase